MLTPGCINSKPGPCSVGVLGFWWLQLLKRLCPCESRPNMSQVA